MSGLQNILAQGEKLYKGEDGKVDYKQLGDDAKDAYASFSKKDGSAVDNAKKAFADIQENHKATSGSSETKTEEKK